MKSLLLSLLFLCGCRGLPEFPAQSIYEYIPQSKECFEYPIISKDPLKVGDGKLIENCPLSVFGFSNDDTANVFTWIRNSQKYAKEKCSN